ncbi:membrane protein [Galliscardovia ingluviei]|uniref:Membrane protein n=1 Tax=Galliscardovia ingluviei TaxID=1769422 RepID=A0A8J3AFS2_9BIFI|nr:TRIC cation channel family protein [Galliscardovia ingluviei]GGI13498.1 membrane protein [Galliscardovia ingluviei]
MELTLESTPFLLTIELAATLCCGMVGGLSAVKRQYDMFVIIITAWLTALGGGVIRDVLLGVLPPVNIANRMFVLTGLAAGILVAVLHPEVDKLHKPMLVLDALALGLFAVNGTEKGLLYGMSGMTSVILGMATALGGGLIRDMLINEVPMVIRDRHWYAVPSAIGCVLTVLVARGAQHHWYSHSVEMIGDLCIVALVVALRIASVKFNWLVPGALKRTRAHLPELPHKPMRTSIKNSDKHIHTKAK